MDGEDQGGVGHRANTHISEARCGHPILRGFRCGPPPVLPPILEARCLAPGLVGFRCGAFAVPPIVPLSDSFGVSVYKRYNRDAYGYFNSTRRSIGPAF